MNRASDTMGAGGPPSASDPIGASDLQHPRNSSASELQHARGPSPSDPLARAAAVGKLMMADDRAARHLGIELVEIAPGMAKMRMAVRPEFTNGHGICHGGYIFLLADTTFAYACNSRNQRTVAAGCSIEFLAPAHEGDRLEADAVEQHLAGRTGVYDIRVHDQNGKLVALFRGKSATIKGRFFEESV